MRDFVRLGDAAMVATFQQQWIERAGILLMSIGLGAATAPANDPLLRGRRQGPRGQVRDAHPYLLRRKADGDHIV